MAIEFTKAQQNAIKTPSGALVSAAAGSGKTAVLVERVIKKITGKTPKAYQSNMPSKKS